MTIKEFFMKIHKTVARVVLGRKNIALDAACKQRSMDRRAAMEKHVTEIEQQASRIYTDAGLVTHGHRDGD